MTEFRVPASAGPSRGGTLNAFPNPSKRGLTKPAIGTVIQLSTFLVAPPERVWAAVRNFDSKSTRGLLKVLHQESQRKLVYAVLGLPRTVKSMIGQVELQPDGPGTRLHWSLRFSTKATLFARLLRPLVRAGIARTLRQALRKFKLRLETSSNTDLHLAE